MKGYTGNIFDRDTIVHLRIPFSLFLFPIFCFAVSQAATIDWFNTAIVFISLHFFIYPGSNVYNSYMDNDKGSIGGLKNPPPATVKLYYASIIFDSIGLLLCLFVNMWLALFILVFVFVSKAYSWRSIRLKKYAILSWLIVMLFQGGFTFLIVNMSCTNKFNAEWFNLKNIECMIIASLLIGGFYPLTQIYQHEEDSSRGDYTISYRLGVTGTFVFSALLFLIACAISYHYFGIFYNIQQFYIFNLCLLPVIIYFLYWFIKTIRNKLSADFTHSMRMTILSSLCMIVCFTVIFLLNHRLPIF